MPGGVGGAAPRGVPLSRSILVYIAFGGFSGRQVGFRSRGPSAVRLATWLTVCKPLVVVCALRRVSPEKMHPRADASRFCYAQMGGSGLLGAIMHLFGIPVAAVGLSLGCTAALAQERLPTTPGTCALTTITSTGARLVDGSTGRPIPGSGSAVNFANKGYQVSYGEELGIAHSQRGDRVYLCLMKVPKGCPPGDNRGRIYTTTNLRNMESWTLPDSEHSCGGA